MSLCIWGSNLRAGVKKNESEKGGKGGIEEMSVNGSVVSNDSVDVKAMMEVLEAPVAPTKKGRVLKKKVEKVVAPITPLAIEPEVEPVVEEVVEQTAEEKEAVALMEGDTNDESKGIYKMYAELLEKYNALVAKTTKAKNENSPDLVEGIHMRMVNGRKTKTKYIFPYQADGGKSIVKEMKDGQKCIGVSTTQKNNSKGSCKVADYDLIWVNAKIVKDTHTGKVYSHKDGKFAILDEDTMTSFNVRMMVVAE